jgi:hypothetical protein
MASLSDAVWASFSVVLYAGMTCKTVYLLQYGYDKYGKYDDKVSLNSVVVGRVVVGLVHLEHDCSKCADLQ